MELSRFGIGKRDLRQGPGRGNGNDHLDDLVGSTEFYVYQPGDQKLRGYESLRLYLEAQGCEALYTSDVPPELGANYQALRITHNGEAIPVPVLKRAHSWAHQRGLFHSFFIPLYR